MPDLKKLPKAIMSASPKSGIFFIFGVFILIIIFSDYSIAAFHEQLAVDTRAIALANTVTADPPGIMAIHYNPAGLVNLPDGKFFSMGITVPIIVKTSRFKQDPEFEGYLGGYNDDPLDGTEGTNSSGKMYLPGLNDTIDFLIAPSIGVSHHEPESRWTFAIAEYAPFAIGLKHGDANDPARYGGKSVYQQHLVYSAPAAGYRLTETFAIGMTVGLGQTAMGAEVDMRAPNEIVALTHVLGEATAGLEIPVLSEMTLPPPWFGGGLNPYDQLATLELTLRDDYSPNYNFGILWQPKQWFAFGACYQSSIKAQLTGTYSFKYSEDWQRMVQWFGSSPLLVVSAGVLDLPIEPVEEQTGTVTAEIEFPQRLQMGIKVKPFTCWSLLIDVHWAEWSAVKDNRFTFDQNIQLLQLVKLMGYTHGSRELYLNRNMKDTWHWSIGSELQVLDWLTLRCGYERRVASVRDNRFDLLYALPELENYGTGFGIQMESGVNIDFAAAYLINNSYKIDNNQSTNLNSTEFTDPVYNPYAGLDYEQETTAYIFSLKISMPTILLSDFFKKQYKKLKGLFD